MRIARHCVVALGCVSMLTLIEPAASQPNPRAKPQQAASAKDALHRAAKATAARRAANEDRSNRLVSFAVTQPPKRPPLGWPALVAEARKYMGTNPTARSRLWCATFMNMVLAKSGYQGTNSDAAKSFAQYGRRISEPKVGAIAVLTRGKNGGHVGVVSGVDSNGNPIIISGNHGARVGEAIYPRSRVIAYVMPSDGPPAATQLAARAATPRASDGGLESPITELLAAIAAERSGRPATAARRDLPLDPALAEFLGLKRELRPAPQPAMSQPQPQSQPQLSPERMLRVDPRGRVAAEPRLASQLGLALAR